MDLLAITNLDKSTLIEQIRSDQLCGPICIVMGNQSADLDSVMSAIAFSEAMGSKYLPLVNVFKEDLSLRKDVIYLLNTLGISEDALLFREDLPNLLKDDQQSLVSFVLVDHNDLAPNQKEIRPYVKKIIDHHADEQASYPHLQIENKHIAKVGSNATLVAQEIFQNYPEKIDQKLALMLLAPILLDTNHLQNPKKTTSLDIAIADALKIRAQDLYTPDLHAYLLAKKNEVDKDRPDLLIKKDFKNYQEGALYYAISSLPKGIDWTVENRQDWQEEAAHFLTSEKLDLWIGLVNHESEKSLIFYSPNSKLLTALMIYMQGRKELSHEVRYIGYLPEDHLLFYSLQNALPRKELQPLFSFKSSPLIQSATLSQ